MKIEPTSHSAMATIRFGLEKAERAQEVIAKSALDANEVGASEARPNDITKAIVSLKEAELQTKAGATLAKAADETIGILLDTRA